MQSVLDALALSLVGAGLVTLLLPLVALPKWQSGLPMAMELWTAAGLLRLAGDSDWTRLATAAAIVAVRRLVLTSRRVASSS